MGIVSVPVNKVGPCTFKNMISTKFWIILGLATLALVLTKADPEAGYRYRRYGYKPYYSGYRKYSPRYYGRKFYHAKANYPYPYHKGYPAGVPEVIDPLPQDVRELPIGAPHGAVPLPVEAEPVQPVPVDNSILVNEVPLAPQPVQPAQPVQPVQVAQPAQPVPAQAVSVQPKQEPIAIVQPLVIGEPQPAVVKSVPANVFRPQFQFFADAPAPEDEELLIAQQLASAMPAPASASAPVPVPAPKVSLVPVP